LDLISQRLARSQINHVLVDGRVTNTERIVRMKSFKEDPQMTVLLMSIGTGAVGWVNDYNYREFVLLIPDRLNLTAANYVHIVEPQWNPSVEEQAIARALRMGQTRSVTVFRYVMKDTVEQVIRPHCLLECQANKQRVYLTCNGRKSSSRASPSTLKSENLFQTN
jgi:SNF2 family DNA or RNA helicase